MSTPDQPNTPGLTRKQLREIRMTGATPVVGADAAEPADIPAPVESVVVPSAAAPGAANAAPAPFAPPPAVAPGGERPAPAVQLPRPAEPVVAPAPTPDAQVDLGVAPLTRRQAREQERIRTASVPVITPDVVAAHEAGNPWAPPVTPMPAAAAPAFPVVSTPPEVPSPDAPAVAAAEESVPTITQLFGISSTPVAAPEPVEATVEPASTVEPEPEPEPVPVPAAWLPVESAADEQPEAPVAPSQAGPSLRPEFGAALLAGAAVPAPLAPSFDELIARDSSTTGSTAMPHALILSQTPSSPLTSPVAATGEVLITGTLSLPESLGSRGHLPGATDGKEVDAVLIDGELPASSSPTPIAASAAISTVKGTGEIIRPPAPEKGNKLMLSLAITAGVLAVSLLGVLVVAFFTGVFS